MEKIEKTRFIMAKIIGKIRIQNWEKFWKKSKFNIEKNLGLTFGHNIEKNLVRNWENQDPDSLNDVGEKLNNNLLICS